MERLTTEDLRLLIGQQIGLAFLVPVALEVLQADPFAEGAFFRGDLLKNVLTLPSDFWSAQPDLLREVREVGMELERMHDLMMTELLPALRRLQD